MCNRSLGQLYLQDSHYPRLQWQWWYVHLSLQAFRCRIDIHSHANLFLYLVRVFIIHVVLIRCLQPLVIIVLFILIDVNLILLIGRSLARSREWNEGLSLVQAVTRGRGQLCPWPRDPPLEPVLSPCVPWPQNPPGEVWPGPPARPPGNPPLEGVTLGPGAGPYQPPAEGRTSGLHLEKVTIKLWRDQRII